MGRNAYGRDKPVFKLPFTPNAPLTADERLRLARHPLLQGYPVAEFLTAREIEYCTFERWRWQQGDER